MKLLTFFEKQGGYAQSKEIKNADFQTRDIRYLYQTGHIEKIKPGLYRLATLSVAENIHFLDVSKAIPQAVICLLSALEYYDLTTFIPSQIHIAIPHTSKPAKIIYPPINTYYFRERFYQLGIEKIKTTAGIIRIYNREKTICDMFRYRNKLGEDLALEGLKNYLKQPDRNINKLRTYAEFCQVKTILYPYLKAMLIE